MKSLLIYNLTKDFNPAFYKELKKLSAYFNVEEYDDIVLYDKAINQNSVALVIICTSVIDKSIEAFKKNFSTIPHLLITTNNNDLKAFNLLEEGLKDYLFTDSITKLLPLINREITVHETLLSSKQTIETLSNCIEQAPLATITWDLDFKVVNWNKTAEEVFGYTAAEAIGKSAYELTVIKGNEAKAKIIFKDILNQSGKTDNINDTLKKGDATFLCHWFNTTVKDKNGKVTGVISTAEDISEKRAIHNKISKKNYLLKQAQKLSEVFNIEISLDSQRVKLDKEFIKLSGLDIKSNFTPKYLLENLIHPEDRLKLLRSFYEAVKENKKLAIDVRVIYSNGSIRWINILADFFTDEVTHKKSLLGTFIDITDRKNEIIQLKEQKEKLDLAVNIMQLGFLTTDIKTNTVEISGNTQKIFELNKSKTLFDLKEIISRIHPEDRLKVEKAIKIAIEKHKAYLLNYRLLLPSGSVIWVNVRGKIILDKDNKPDKLMGVIRDITTQVKRERKLLQHSIILNQMSSLVVVMDKNTDIVFASPSVTRETGYTIGEILGQGWNEKSYSSDEDRNRSRELFRSIVANPDAINNLKYERKVKCKNGAVKLFSWQFTVGTEDSIIGLANDITKEKEKDQLVTKLFKAIENSPAIVIITDINGNIEFVNPKFEAVTGYTSKEVIGLNPRVLSTGYTTKKDYQNLWQTISSGKNWSGEFRNKKKDGSIFWENAVITPVKNAEGVITNYIALKEDITEKKAQEKKFLFALFEAQENEKLKFGEELHDSLSQTLSAMSFYIEAVLNPKNTKDHLKVDYLEKIRQLAYDALRETRNISHGLMSKQLIESGLVAATIEICTNYNVSNRINFSFKNSGYQETDFDIEKKQTIFRIIQEITTNIVKHSQATKAKIKFSIKNSEWFVLEINDNGIGINQELIKENSKCFGLKNIQQRVTLLNGFITRESSPKIGTKYIIKLPLVLESVNSQLN